MLIEILSIAKMRVCCNKYFAMYGYMGRATKVTVRKYNIQV